MNYFDYIEELRYRASRCHLSQKEMAKKTGLSVATLNAHLNHPQNMRLWELEAIETVVKKCEQDLGCTWKPKGGYNGQNARIV